MITAIAITSLLVSTSTAVTRPPVPTDVPFEYDPNLCSSSLMDFVITEPNVSVVSAIGGHNRWGLDLELDVARCDGQIIDVNVQRMSKVKDPNGGWNQYWQWSWTPPASLQDEVYYLELRLIDEIGRQNRRTILVYAVQDDPPFLFPVRGPIPVARVKQAQRHWQWVKKHGKTLTSPTRVARNYDGLAAIKVESLLCR